MIRSHFAGVPTRRLAVVEIQRQRARLGHLVGLIGPGGQVPNRDTAVAWTTVNDETPDSSGNFLSSVIADQNSARTSMPGTLAYTPANTTPPPVVAPWNSWLQPNCAPAGSIPTTPNAQVTAPTSNALSGWVILAAIVGGVASLKAIFSSDREGRR